MSPILIITLIAVVLAVASLLRVAYVLIVIGTDVHATGPWKRPMRQRSHTRLPSDFRGLWSLLGPRSLDNYPGSWEAAVRRLDRVEESLTGSVAPKIDVPVEPSQGWLIERVADLEALLEPSRQGTPPTLPARHHQSLSELRSPSEADERPSE